MYAIEFESRAKDGIIYIPERYKKELDNKENIKLVVLYDTNISTLKAENEDLKCLKKLFDEAKTTKIAPTININEITNDINHDKLF